MRADAHATHLECNDARKFWNNIHKECNSRATKYATTISNATGDGAITDLWVHHFGQLYNKLDCDKDRDAYFNILDLSRDKKMVSFSVDQIKLSLCKQKKGKSAGPDTVSLEAFLFGGHRLAAHLALLFNAFTSHCYLPKSFMDITIVPLVKSKGGDLADVNNYRAIAISNSISKIYRNTCSLIT